MGCLKLYGLFVALITSAALANPVNIPKRNISSRDNVNSFSYHLPTLPDIAALPTNVQVRGLLDHLPTLAGPATYALQHTQTPTEEKVNVKQERVKRTTYTTLCTGGLRDDCYGPITLPILPDWTSEAIETTTTTSSSKSYGAVPLSYGAPRPASAHNPFRTGNHVTETNNQREGDTQTDAGTVSHHAPPSVITYLSTFNNTVYTETRQNLPQISTGGRPWVAPSVVTWLRTSHHTIYTETGAYSAYMASATEHCNTTLSRSPHRTSFTETIQNAPSTTTKVIVSRDNWGPYLSPSFSHHVSAPTMTQGLLNIATVTGTGAPSSITTHALHVANAEHYTTTSTSYSSFLAPFSSYPGCTYTRWGQLAPMQNGPVKIEWYSTTTDTVYGKCYGCDDTFHDVRPNGYGATGDNGKRFTTTIYSHSVITVLTPTCVPTPWPTWWTNAEATAGVVEARYKRSNLEEKRNRYVLVGSVGLLRCVALHGTLEFVLGNSR